MQSLGHLSIHSPSSGLSCLEAKGFFISYPARVSLYSPRLPGTQRSTCLCLLSAQPLPLAEMVSTVLDSCHAWTPSSTPLLECSSHTFIQVPLTKSPLRPVCCPQCVSYWSPSFLYFCLKQRRYLMHQSSFI